MGLGTEKDSAKAQEIINEIKEIYNIRNGISSFFTKEDLVFAIKLADFCYARTKNFSESYQNLMRNSTFREMYKDKFEAMLDELSKEPRENAELLLSTYSSIGNYDKMVEFIDYIDEFKIGNFYNTLDSAFYSMLEAKQVETIEKLLKTKNFYLILDKSYPEAIIYLAYCKMYGYGIEADRAEANVLIDKYVDLTKDRRNTYNLERLAKFKLENVDNFVYAVANVLSDKGDSKLLSICLKNGIGCEKDRAKSFLIDFKIAKENNFTYSLRNQVIINFRNAYTEGLSTKEMEKLTFETLDNCLGDRYISISDIMIYYNLILLGNGDEESKAKAFKKLEELAEKKDSLAIIEALAYFYDNGIGTEKDAAKAKELRLEIDNIISEKPAKDKWRAYYFIGTYTSREKELDKIYSPEMIEFYKKKAAPFKYEHDLGDMSEADIKLMMEFREISKLFQDEKGNPVKTKEAIRAAKDKAKPFFQKVLDAKSEAIYKIAEFSFDFNDTTDLDTLQLRVTGLPYFEKAADDYCPKLYKHLAYAYERARATRGDYKIAGDYFFKVGSLEERIPELPKGDAFKKAFEMYLKVGDYDLAKKSLDEWEKVSEPSLYLDRTKAMFYLYESDYKDVDYAKVLIAKIKESADDENKLWSIMSYSITYNFLELKELRFWAAQRLYDLGIDKLEPWSIEYAYKQLIEAHLRGIYCEKDIEKGLALLKEYFVKGGTKYVYDAFVVDQLLIFLRDVEDKDPVLLKSTLESLLEVNADSPSLNLVKAIAIDEEFGYEKDIALRDSCLEKASKRNSLLWSLLKRENILTPNNDLLATYVKLCPKESTSKLGLYNAYLKLGNLEEAQKYGKLYDAQGTVVAYNSSDMAIFLIKAESDEALAERFSKSKTRGAKAIYASMLYQGKGVAQDKEKAVEIFESLSKLWNAGSPAGDNSRLWLWLHYTETNQQDKAQALIDSKTQGSTLYSSKLFAKVARIFMDNLDIEFINYTSNMPRNEQYAKYFLELMEEKYPSQYADTLIELYGTNPNFQNLEKKKEIRAKAKAMLNTPPARAKEEVNYPDKKKIIKKIKIN